MKRIILFIFIVLDFTALSQAQHSAKLSPYTRLIINQVEKLLKEGKQLDDPEFVNQHALFVESNEVSVKCFLHTETENNIDRKALESLGVELNNNAGRIWTCRIPVLQIGNVRKIDCVKYIEASQPVKPLLDSARSVTNTNHVQAGTGLSQAYKGENVVVGVIDRGFDYTHPTFYDETLSTYRVKRARNFAYGGNYTSQSTILAAQHDGTLGNHATHVAGIAGGSGGTTNATYRGVAPNSDLVFVTANTSSDILNGFSYIKSYAQSEGKPCVANISLGSNYGPNDGTSSFEQMMDSYSGAGAIACISSGNEGDSPIFAKKIQTGVDTMNVICNASGGSLEGNVCVWGEPNNQFSISIALYNSSTGQFVASTPFVQTSTSESYNNSISYSSATCAVQVVTDNSDYNNNKPNATIYINYSNGSNNIRPVVRVRSSAADGTTTRIWSPSFSFRTDVPSGFTSGSTEETVNCLATGYNTICVGAWTSRKYFYSMQYGNTGWGSWTIGDIASFSSKGPAADGRIKPSITAPGQFLISSYQQFL